MYLAQQVLIECDLGMTWSQSGETHSAQVKGMELNDEIGQVVSLHQSLVGGMVWAGEVGGRSL